MRYLYSLLLYLALPFILVRMLWRSRKLSAYRHRFKERLGFYNIELVDCIWVHAVSVGEVLAAAPMIEALLTRHPSIPLLVTTMTPTGSARVQAVFGDRVKHVYLPYDFPDAVARFLNAMQPRICIIIETELWPNLLAACHQRDIPVCLVNARLSEKSARGYQRIAPLTKEILQYVTMIATHGQKDAERFIKLGADKSKVEVTGNLKFDLALPIDLEQRTQALRESIGERPVWLAASTHEGEEDILLQAHHKIQAVIPNSLLILVPRHPDRFEEVYLLCEKHFDTVRRNEAATISDNITVYLGNTMGELMTMYAVADVVFVGGSLIPRGGHNILEPAALAKPIMTGPSDFNFAEIAELFVANDALVKIEDADALADQVIAYLQNKSLAQEKGNRALDVMNNNRGALAKQLQIIDSLLWS